jgi:hypothetical protein
MVRAWWSKASKNRKRRAAESAAALAIIGVVVWQYGGLAPQVIIVLSFLLSLFVLLVQMPFMIGFYGIGRFRPLLVVAVLSLPFLIGQGYEAAYGKDLFLLWYMEWLGGMRPASAFLVIASLPVLSFLSGLLGRNMRRP